MSVSHCWPDPALSHALTLIGYSHPISQSPTLLTIPLYLSHTGARTCTHAILQGSSNVLFSLRFTCTVLVLCFVVFVVLRCMILPPSFLLLVIASFILLFLL